MRVLRSRRLPGLAVLAVMLLGIAANAAVALASGDCCAGMTAGHASSEPAAPCHSVAPTSCCEAGATGQPPAAPGAPALAASALAIAPACARFPARAFAPAPARTSAAALASVVLRL